MGINAILEPYHHLNGADMKFCEPKRLTETVLSNFDSLRPQGPRSMLQWAKIQFWSHNSIELDLVETPGKQKDLWQPS